jgi:Mce-associated membrane protein
MADKTPRRPVVGSRTPGQRPRRVAGQTSRPVGSDTPPTVDQPTVEEPTVGEPTVDEPRVEQPRLTEPPSPTGAPADGVLSRQRTTVVLGAVLAGLLVAISVLTWQVVDDDEPAAQAAWHFQGADKPFDPPKHPMSVNYVEWRNASDATTNAVLDILTVHWKTYDEHLESAKKRMTDSWAKEYARTADDTRTKFLAAKADYDFEVVGQSVITASATKVTALLFLNQYVYKGVGKDRVGPDVYQVRVIVEAVASGDEWLVNELRAL